MNDLEQRTLEVIQENVSSPDVFTDDEGGLAQIRDSLNDAIAEICLLTGSVKRQYFLPLETDRMFYRFRFTRDVLTWITDVWYVDQQRRLEQTDFIRLAAFNHRWMQNTGSPESYVPIGFQYICFWPRPSGDGLVQINAAIIPERYVLETEPIRLRQNWEAAAVDYAASEFFASRGDAKTAIYYLNRYVKALGLIELYPEAAERIPYYRTMKQPWPRSTA